MKICLTHKQKLLLRTAGMTAVIYLVFKYLIPLLLPFLIAVLLSIPIRPAARFLYKKSRIPMGVAVALVLVGVLALAGVGVFFLGKTAVEQLMGLAEQLPGLWERCCEGLLDCCGQMERSLRLSQGTITAQLSQLMGLGESGGQPGASRLGRGGMDTMAGTLGGQLINLLGEQLSGLLGSSLQGVVAVLKMLVSVLVTVFVTIGATLITTTQLEELKKSIDRSLFRREIHRITDTLAKVGTAYGKTQLVIMLITTVISGSGLTILGNPYALLLGALIGLVDALPIFGAGTILWPWLLFSALSGDLRLTIGLAVIYAACNLMRQWMEARYMGDRIGLSALENLIAMYVGLQLFGLLGLFWGPIGYLLIKETSRGSAGEGESPEFPSDD